MQPHFARASGAGQIPHGADGVAFDRRALAIASMGLTLRPPGKMVGGVPQISDWDCSSTSASAAVFWVFVMVVPLAVLFSAALLAISLFAKSFKEAQSYLSPLTIVVIAPAIVSVLPGVELNAGLSLIPDAEHEPGQQGDRQRHSITGTTSR